MRKDTSEEKSQQILKAIINCGVLTNDFDVVRERV